MTHPEYLYYVALIVTALCWRFNPLALLLVAVGAAACLAWRFGLLVPASYLAIYGVGLALAVRHSQHTGGILVSILFLPLIALSFYEWSGTISPHDAWWGRYWIVLAQLLVAQFDTDFAAIISAIGKAFARRPAETTMKRAYA